MRSLLIAKREFFSTFDAPTGYVVLGLFPALAAVLFFLTGPYFALNEASLRPFFASMPWLLVILAPAITMRLWAEEQRSGTEELLLTYPFQLRDLVIGKFLGAWAVLALSLLCTIGVPFTASMMGDLDWGPVLGGYFSVMLLGGASLAIGLFLSSITDNQIVAYLLGAAVLMGFNLIGVAATADAMPESFARLFLMLDFGNHFHAITRGVLDLGHASFYLGIIVFFLAANGVVLERRRVR